MNKLLLFSMLLSSTSFAGLPTEDFVIDAIRESFKAGTAPLTNRLLPGDTWVCGIYDTLPGYQSGTVGVTLGGVGFESTLQGILSSTVFVKTDVPYQLKNNSLMSYALKGGKPFAYNFIREFQEGLVVEKAYPSVQPILPSVVDPTLTVYEYSYCLPYQTAVSRKKVFNQPWETIPGYQGSK